MNLKTRGVREPRIRRRDGTEEVQTIRKRRKWVRDEGTHGNLS